ncbi:hypothetical protein ZWY2020_032090 [Hordeum vulgare]|nr:hypothetical protein ZWY2020_032090 [Hordeum vulgare]
MDELAAQQPDVLPCIGGATADLVALASPVESQASLSLAEAELLRGRDPVLLVEGGDGLGTAGGGLHVCSEATSGWTRRIGKASVEREGNPNRKTALEISMRAYISKRDGNVVNPAVGTEFDSLDEAYQFYNLYSWEVGFGIRFAKSRLNVNRRKCMQEIACGCASKPLRENTRSTRCGCTARISLLRSSDNGWYINEHRDAHNHNLSATCGEKMH